MASVSITVTQGNITNSHLYATAAHAIPGFLPSDILTGGTIQIELDGLNETIETDCFRNRFRNRSFAAAFYRFHNVQPEDVVVLEKLRDRHYRLKTTAGSTTPFPSNPTTEAAIAEIAQGERTGGDDSDPLAFKLEKHLEDFIAHNWSRIEDFRGWTLIGVQYPSATGPIDMLAKNAAGEYLVVELKRSKTSDQTVGQILRYMSWVDLHLADGRDVKGYIVAHEQDEAIRYAVRRARDVSLMTYEISFKLNSVPSP